MSLQLTTVGSVCRTLIAVLIIVLITVPASARTVVPPPPGGGEGTTIYAPDMALPFTPGSPVDISRFLPDCDAPFTAPAADNVRNVAVGGDDITVLQANHLYYLDFAVASNGNMFTATVPYLSR